jgi:hypothetical protein
MCDYSLHHVKTRPAKVGDAPETRRLASARRSGARVHLAKNHRCIGIPFVGGG